MRSRMTMTITSIYEIPETIVVGDITKNAQVIHWVLTTPKASELNKFYVTISSTPLAPQVASNTLSLLIMEKLRIRFPSNGQKAWA